MNRYKAILFDMDGTLLPMEMESFTNGYFKLLFAKLAKYIIDSKTFAGSMWAGVEAMVQNDGSETNDKAFWRKFEELTGISEAVIGKECLEFYSKEFHQAKCLTKENPLAAEAVALAHKKAPIVALATNPLFPMVGQQSRMSEETLQHCRKELL